MCSILSALRKPEGVPSTVPIAQIVDGCERDDFNVKLAEPPAETETYAQSHVNQGDSRWRRI